MYNISGVGTVIFEGHGGDAHIDVVEGAHQFQAVVSLGNDTDVEVRHSALLSFNNELDLDGNTLLKSGLGTLEINNRLSSGDGSIVALAGTIAGSGTIGGDVDNSGGTISPGNSPDVLEVEGDTVVPEPAGCVLMFLATCLTSAVARRRG